MILLDVDHFKAINDTHGHASGDMVLKHLGQLLRGQLRESDSCARWGGEEFVIALKNTDLAGRETTAERLLSRVRELNIPAGSDTLHITASMGVSMYDGGESLDAVIDRADRAMYCAKVGGRDRVALQELARTQSEHEAVEGCNPEPPRAMPLGSAVGHGVTAIHTNINHRLCTTVDNDPELDALESGTTVASQKDMRTEWSHWIARLMLGAAALGGTGCAHQRDVGWGVVGVGGITAAIGAAGTLGGCYERGDSSPTADRPSVDCDEPRPELGFGLMAAGAAAALAGAIIVHTAD